MANQLELKSATYRWKVENNTIVSIGDNDNAITTIEGGIVNGVFNNARYKLEKPFKLLHNKPWVLEWWNKGAVDNEGGMAKIFDETGQQTASSSRCILLRETSKSLTFTRYGDTHYHYGVRLDRYGIDYAAEHIYRLENRVNDDGTNMVWLYVDGVEIAPMMDSFSNKGEEGLTNWVSGKDFSMGYIGTPRYIPNGFIMDDIAVWEDGIPAAYDKDAFINGLSMGLISKGNPTFTASDDFSTGYVLGAELRKERNEPTPIYGVEWDYSKSSTKLARTDDAAAFIDPAPATSLTETGTSPFDNLMPWYGMKRVTIGTDEMVYIPKFYYRVEDDATNSKMRWKITHEPREGFTLHPGSGRYISRYHISAGYASVSGAAPIGGMTRATARTNSHAKGEGWWLNDLATWSAIRILYLVEFADWNSQVVLGYGQTSDSLVKTGATDTAVYHTIKRDNASNQYRYIENPYSNIRDWLDGVVCVDHRVWVGEDNAAYTDTTKGYTDTGLSIPRTGGAYITRLSISDVAPWAFIPTAASGGSATTYIPDYSIGGSTNVTMHVTGGKSSYAATWGLFKFDSNDAASFTASDVGARLIYIP